jgi:hypothetical protein
MNNDPPKKKRKKKKKVNLFNNFEAYNVMNGITCWVIICIHILVILDVVARHIKNSSNLLQRKGTYVQHIYHKKKVAIEK